MLRLQPSLSPTSESYQPEQSRNIRVVNFEEGLTSDCFIIDCPFKLYRIGLRRRRRAVTDNQKGNKILGQLVQLCHVSWPFIHFLEGQTWQILQDAVMRLSDLAPLFKRFEYVLMLKQRII